MASKAINLRIENLIASVKGLNKKEAAKLCTYEVRFLKKKYKINTAMTYLTEYRAKLIKTRPELSRYLSVGKRTVKARIRRSKKILIKKMSKKIKISNHDVIISRAKELLNSDKYADIALGLCLLTGRRLTEILKTAKFKSYKRRRYMLEFKGQLKKKFEFGYFPIYALGNSSKECKIALKRLRSLIDTSKMTNKEVERKYHVVVNQRATINFGEFIGRCTAHKLRGVYAYICDSVYRGELDTSIFLGRILGHNELDTDTSLAYKKYIL